MSIVYKILISAGVIVGIFFSGVLFESQRCKLKQEKAATKQLESDSKVVSKLDDSKDRHDTAVRERVKVIYETIDNCIGQRAPDSVLDSLR